MEACFSFFLFFFEEEEILTETKKESKREIRSRSEKLAKKKREKY